jgi:hypothetical protein
MRTHTDPIQRRQFLHSSCMGVFVGSIMDWWVKELGCAYCNTITDSHSLCYNGTCMRMMGNTASGGWENCCVVGEHMHMANLFLNIFIKMVNFLWRFYQLDENLRCSNVRWLGVYWSSEGLWHWSFIPHKLVMLDTAYHHRYVCMYDILEAGFAPVIKCEMVNGSYSIGPVRLQWLRLALSNNGPNWVGHFLFYTYNWSRSSVWNVNWNIPKRKRSVEHNNSIMGVCCSFSHS